MPDREDPAAPPSEGLNFRYTRESRLARAGDAARWLESRRGAKGPGLVGSLVATPATRILFGTILILLLLSLLVPYLDSRAGREEGELGGRNWEADALYFEGRVLVVLRSIPLLAKPSKGNPSAEPGASPDGSPSTFGLRIVVPGGGSLSSLLLPQVGEAQEQRFAVEASDRVPERVSIRLEGGEKVLELRIPVK